MSRACPDWGRGVEWAGSLLAQNPTLQVGEYSTLSWSVCRLLASPGLLQQGMSVAQNCPAGTDLWPLPAMPPPILRSSLCHPHRSACPFPKWIVRV